LKDIFCQYLLRFGYRQKNGKAGSKAWFGFDLDPAAVELDQAFDDTQAQAGTAAGFGGEEGFEDFLEGSSIEPL
jgi:hypothetical protein